MQYTPTLHDLKNGRVRIDLTDSTDPVFGLLSGVTEQQILVDGTSHPLDTIDSVESAPLTCDNCGKNTLRTFHRDGLGMVCAVCYRREASYDRPSGESCAICGSKPAYRNPRSSNKDFLCSVHHAQSGVSLVIPGAVATHIMADCATEDISSPKHEWKQVRKSRQRCLKCKRDKFESADISD